MQRVVESAHGAMVRHAASAPSSTTMDLVASTQAFGGRTPGRGESQRQPNNPSEPRGPCGRQALKLSALSWQANGKSIARLDLDSSGLLGLQRQQLGVDRPTKKVPELLMLQSLPARGWATAAHAVGLCRSAETIEGTRANLEIFPAPGTRSKLQL